MRSTLELVAALKLVAFRLQLPQMPPQPVQLVAALRRLGTELADCGRRCLTDGAEAAFEVESGQSLLLRAELIEQHAMRDALLRLCALDNAVLDVVEGDAVGGRLLAGAALGTG